VRYTGLKAISGLRFSRYNYDIVPKEMSVRAQQEGSALSEKKWAVPEPIYNELAIQDKVANLI